MPTSIDSVSFERRMLLRGTIGAAATALLAACMLMGVSVSPVTNPAAISAILASQLGVAAMARLDDSGRVEAARGLVLGAGARRLRQEGVIAPSERVVCILTGHQLKDPNATIAYHSADQKLFEVVLRKRGGRRAKKGDDQSWTAGPAVPRSTFVGGRGCRGPFSPGAVARSAQARPVDTLRSGRGLPAGLRRRHNRAQRGGDKIGIGRRTTTEVVRGDRLADQTKEPASQRAQGNQSRRSRQPYTHHVPGAMDVGCDVVLRSGSQNRHAWDRRHPFTALRAGSCRPPLTCPHRLRADRPPHVPRRRRGRQGCWRSQAVGDIKTACYTRR